MADSYSCGATSTSEVCASSNAREMFEMHMDLMTLYTNNGLFQNSVWQGSFKGVITISIETLVRQTFQAVSQHSSGRSEWERLAADIVVGLLQAAPHPAPAPAEHDVVQQNSQQMENQDKGEVTLTGEVKEEVSLFDVGLDGEEFHRARPREEHKVVNTKNVPKEVVYAVRGVRCRVCGYFIRGPNCLEELIRHTKRLHPLKSTPEHIRLIRIDNSVQNLIGDGIPYCTCKLCRRFGPASFAKRRSTEAHVRLRSLTSQKLNGELPKSQF